jgi:hypothetical protein
MTGSGPSILCSISKLVLVMPPEIEIRLRKLRPRNKKYSNLYEFTELAEIPAEPQPLISPTPKDSLSTKSSISSSLYTNKTLQSVGHAEAGKGLLKHILKSRYLFKLCPPNRETVFNKIISDF